MDDKILALVKSKIDDKRKLLTDALADGCGKDYADYKYVVGQVRGLAVAQQIVDDLLRTIKESNDD